VLLFLGAVPALAVAALLRGLDTGARIVVAVTAAIAINTLVAEAMLASGLWSPRAGLIAIALISAVIGAIGWRSARSAQARPGWTGRPQVPDGGTASRT
jgi:hypothetical protein